MALMGKYNKDKTLIINRILIKLLMFKTRYLFKFYITDKIFKLYLTEEKFMCGIVGYIGYDNAKELLLSGLEKLEYRGYDSAGIAVANDNGTTVLKKKVVLQN